MIANRVRLYYSSTEYIHLPLDSSIQTSQYILKSIEGLDPPQVDISISKGVNGSSKFQNRFPNNRELIFTIKFRPSYSVGQTTADLRTQLYNLLSPSFGGSVLIEFRDSLNVVLRKVTGYVKRIEGNPFSKEPEVRITFPCMSSYLEAANDYTIPSPSGLSKNPIPITNIGNAPTGMFIKLTFTSSGSYFQLRNSDYSQNFEILNYSYSSGDILSIWTEPGQRKVELLHSSTNINLAPYIKTNGEWLTLYNGVSGFYPNITSFTLNEITYLPKYWGM